MVERFLKVEKALSSRGAHVYGRSHGRKGGEIIGNDLVGLCLNGSLELESYETHAEVGHESQRFLLADSQPEGLTAQSLRGNVGILGLDGQVDHYLPHSLMPHIGHLDRHRGRRGKAVGVDAGLQRHNADIAAYGIYARCHEREVL